jgi:adenylate cyclase
MPRDAGRFARSVLSTYEARRDPLTVFASKSAGWSTPTRADHLGTIGARPMGHPAFADLPLGASGHCEAAALFLDLDGFTARTFWDSPESMVDLAQAVLTQLVEVIVENGGHVLGLRGDGVFACFGAPGSDKAVDVSLALGAAAFALDATQGALNQLLALSDLDPVRLRAGADHGRLDFVRTGVAGASEVNVISFAANFAAKCEKTANSWEMVVGEGLANSVPNRELLSARPGSPKIYQRDGLRRAYSFYDVYWRSLVPHTVGIAEELAGAPTSRIKRN